MNISARSGLDNAARAVQRARAMLFGRKMRAAVWRWLKRLEVARRYRQDVRQDIFLGALQSFYTYDPHRARPERWLNRIVVHIASRHRQRAVHRREELRQDFSRVRDHTPTASGRELALRRSGDGATLRL